MYVPVEVSKEPSSPMKIQILRSDQTIFMVRYFFASALAAIYKHVLLGAPRKSMLLHPKHLPARLTSPCPCECTDAGTT